MTCLALIASVIVSNATPAQVVASCRAMMPEKVEVAGTLVVRNRRGIPLAEHKYALKRETGVTDLSVDGTKLEQSDGRILNTDVTWSDLTLDFLWWTEAKELPESETVHGQSCTVIELSKEKRTVRIWVDRKTGVMMQAEELAEGKTIRRLWGTRIKKFEERWAPHVLEVETTGSGHRTKITVEELKI